MKGGTVVECSSGNTGVALSMVCAVKGLKMKVFTTDNASKEKIEAFDVAFAKRYIDAITHVDFFIIILVGTLNFDCHIVTCSL